MPSMECPLQGSGRAWTSSFDKHHGRSAPPPGSPLGLQLLENEAPSSPQNHQPLPCLNLDLHFLSAHGHSHAPAPTWPEDGCATLKQARDTGGRRCR